MNWNDDYSSGPIRVKGGIKTRSETGEFARNWWARKWLQAMERLVARGRLQRGQAYARQGQVVSFEEAPEGITAKVQGSRKTPYKVTIKLSPLTERQWNKVLDVLSSRAVFVAQLLAGEMPAEIEEAFSTAGVSLFPRRSGDLKTKCTCPDWANPCKHVAATHYILGDRFDEDPFLLFRLRGKTQEQVLEGLRKRRDGAAGDEDTSEEDDEDQVEPTLSASLSSFWELQAPLENIAINFHSTAIQMPILKRLGDSDWMGNLPLQDILKDAYKASSEFALLMAFSGAESEPLPSTDENNTSNGGI
jgi:uncharacterized Zn finger protein